MKSIFSGTRSGFTLAEISLSTAFLAILAIAIAIVSGQLALLSQKGIAINNINDTARELVDEFSRSITSSNYDLFYSKRYDSHDPNSFKYVFNQTKDSNGHVLYGAFCNGYESYIWNTGYALNGGNTSNIAVYEGYSPTGDGFRLLRVSDADQKVCETYYEHEVHDRSKLNQFSGGVGSAEEVLSDSSSGMVLYDMQVFEPTYSQFEKHALYSISFVLGTLSGTIELNSSGGYCSPTAIDFATDFPFCAVNKFNFAARATGGLPSETD